MRALLLLLVLGTVGVYSKSCVGQCGINDGNQNECQCNSDCEKFGDCCGDYTSVCNSCVGRCGDPFNHAAPCHCNDECSSHGNCCNDYNSVCGGVTSGPGLLSCVGRCNEHFDPSKPCSCTSSCASHDDCCSDYNDVCGGGGGSASDAELRALTEQILAADVNGVGSQLTIDDQGQTSSSSHSDEAPLPLLTVPESALTGETITLLLALQDNYDPNVSVNEDDTPEEQAEKELFLDAIMATDIMNITETFMHDKDLISRPLRDVIDEIWFTLYSRGGLGSSGFEHSFVGEIKNGKVSGFHNWVRFQNEEKDGHLDYKGWLKAPVSLGTEGEVFMNRYEWLGEPKSIGSMWIGTSPELELAVYTVCFFARPDSLCPITMDGNNFHVQTWNENYGGKTLVGSAYPDID